MYFAARKGTLTVTRDYPNGAYLRPSETGQGSEVEVSPVTSAVQGIYWAIGTATGNDVLTTTTDFGKALKVRPLDTLTRPLSSPYLAPI